MYKANAISRIKGRCNLYFIAKGQNPEQSIKLSKCPKCGDNNEVYDDQDYKKCPKCKKIYKVSKMTRFKTFTPRTDTTHDSNSLCQVTYEYSTTI